MVSVKVCWRSAIEGADFAADGFADIDAGFEEGDGQFGLVAIVEELADVAEGQRPSQAADT
jgi:hypothetical protein